MLTGTVIVACMLGDKIVPTSSSCPHLHTHQKAKRSPSNLEMVQLQPCQLHPSSQNALPVFRLTPVMCAQWGGSSPTCRRREGYWEEMVAEGKRIIGGCGEVIGGRGIASPMVT